MPPFPPEPPAGGLRERKKARTRATLQHEALRLFRSRGYQATTMEQIAEAADVSPSTLFRYFPSKESLVLTDQYDEPLLEAWRSQPAEIGPVEAVRRGLADVLGRLDDEELADMRERAELAVTVPELRAAALDQYAQAIRELIDVMAARRGSSPDDFGTATLAGAILGVLMAAEYYWVDHPSSHLVVLFDEALARLDAGLDR